MCFFDLAINDNIMWWNYMWGMWEMHYATCPGGQRQAALADWSFYDLMYARPPSLGLDPKDPEI